MDVILNPESIRLRSLVMELAQAWTNGVCEFDIHPEGIAWLAQVLYKGTHLCSGTGVDVDLAVSCLHRNMVYDLQCENTDNHRDIRDLQENSERIAEALRAQGHAPVLA